MKINRNGFTLIELLAVIVILAIIALIATPIVLNIISDSKESSGLRSAEMYLDAVEQAISVEKMNNTSFNPNSCTITNEGNLYCDDEYMVKVEVNGEVPESGNITFTNGKIDEISLNYTNGKTVIKNEDESLVYENNKVYTVKELQEKYEFEYYSSLESAVSDANSGNVGINADADKKDATAGIYIDEKGRINVVLLEDVELNEILCIKIGMSLNLGGKILTLNVDSYARGIDINTTNKEELVTIDGRLKNSTINVITNISKTAGILIWNDEKVELLGFKINLLSNVENDETNAWGIYSQQGGTLYINSLDIDVMSNGKTVGISTRSNTTNIHNLKIKANGDEVTTGIGIWGKVFKMSSFELNIESMNYANAIEISTSDNVSTIDIVDGNIIVTSKSDAAATGVAFVPESVTKITNIENSKIYAYNKGNSAAIADFGKNVINIKNSQLYGNVTSIQTNGILNIYGGMYEGYENIIYAENNASINIQNAILKLCEYKEKELYNYETVKTPNQIITLTNSSSDNLSLYMNNCKLEGNSKQYNKHILLMHGSANNKAYLSNCTIDKNQTIGLNTIGQQIYLGQGNNFTSDAIVLPNGADAQNSIFVTNEIYSK